MPPAVEARSLNHWTTREVQMVPTLKVTGGPMGRAFPLPCSLGLRHSGNPTSAHHLNSYLYN